MLKFIIRTGQKIKTEFESDEAVREFHKQNYDFRTRLILKYKRLST